LPIDRKLSAVPGRYGNCDDARTQLDECLNASPIQRHLIDGVAVDHGSYGCVFRIYQRTIAVNSNLGSEIADLQAEVHPGVLGYLQLDSFADNRFEADCANG
jgi:hypothetical protein